MSFDHRAAYADDLQDKYSQQGEGGPNHDNDCVPATFSNILHAYGYRHTKPSWWDAGAGVGLGPISYVAMITFMHKPEAEFPGAPDVRVSGPADVLSAIDGAGAAGFAVAFNGWSDAAGNFKTHPTSVLHVGAVMAHLEDKDGEYVIVLNPEHNTPQRFSGADFRAITGGADAGWLAVFAKPLPGMGPAAAPVPVPPPTPIPPPQPDTAQLAALLTEIAGLKAQVAQEMAIRVNLAQKLVQIRDIVTNIP
jgi:hypothetical protein